MPTHRGARVAVRAAGLLLATATAGCAPEEIGVAIGVMFTEDIPGIAGTDNISVVVDPGGRRTAAVDGPDTPVDIELPPDETPRELSIYYARGASLLAYGTTPAFTRTLAESADIEVLVAAGGRLTAFPGTLATPDADTVATPLGARGLLAVDSDGSSVFLDAYTLGVRAAADWPEGSPLPGPDDGAFLPRPASGAAWVGWAEAPYAVDFSFADNAWTPVRSDDLDDLDPRPGAAHAVEPEGSAVWVFGGANTVDVVRIAIDDDGDVDVDPLDTAELDAPRPGGRAMLVATRGEPWEGIVVGGRVDGPLVWFSNRGLGVGEPSDWEDLRCVVLDPPEATTSRVLCAGGIRDGETTPDGFVVEVDANADPTWQARPAFLSAAAPEVRWFVDGVAVYAQGSSHWDPFDLATLSRASTSTTIGPTLGGQSVRFPTGVTFVVGGEDDSGAASDRWYVFAPDLVAL